MKCQTLFFGGKKKKYFKMQPAAAADILMFYISFNSIGHIETMVISVVQS